MNKLFLAFLILFTTFSSYSQNNPDSPYEMDWTVDGLWIGAGLGLNALGFVLIQNKAGLTEEELSMLSKEDINSIDRGFAGNYSPEADELSYIPFYASFAMPFVMMFNENEKSHAGQISLLFLETMATTGALYTISAGTVARSRPLVYNENVRLEERLESGAQRSWFGGHTAATAAATFFTAKVFSDFNPDSWAKPYIWAAAIAVPAYVAYLRTISGKHFLTDNLTGYAVGALSGIFIPELHKKENSEINFSTFVGKEYKGFSLSYSF